MPESVLEGEDFHLVARMSHRLDQDANVRFSVNNPSRYRWTLTGVPDPMEVRIPQGQLTATVGPLRKPDNDTKDGFTRLGFLLSKTRDDPWTLHDYHREVYVDDDETPESERRRNFIDGKPTANALNTVGHESGTGAVSRARFRVKIHDAKPSETYTFDYETRDGNGGGGRTHRDGRQ